MSSIANPTRILVVEDSTLIRAGLKSRLGNHQDILICGEASDGQSAIELTDQLKPDLVLMDMLIPQLDGIEACKLIRAQHPSVKIVMMTVHESENEIFAALTAGADGYCLKESTAEKLYTAIRTVAEGDFWLDSAIARKVVKTLLTTMSSLSGDGDGSSDKVGEDESLSRRELEVLHLVAQGLSNQKIADKLAISSETVKSHIRHIMKKLVVTDRTQAAVKALRQGLI